MPILGIIASSVLGSIQGDYESIASASPSGVNTVTFSNIPSTYKHLQIRYIGQTARGTYAQDQLGVQFNGDTGSNYNYFITRASEVSSTAIVNSAAENQTNISFDYGSLGATGGSSLFWGIGVIDILDYTNTNKFKTTRCVAGTDSNGTVGGVYSTVGLMSGNWENTNAITSITMMNPATAANYNAGTRFWLYGIKG
jgi:hypothetical protein